MNEDHEKVGKLKKMSEDMKQHIAQLKAELGNVVTEPRTTEMENELRNRAVASALRKHLFQDSVKSSRCKAKNAHVNRNSAGNFSSGDPGTLQKHNTVESLSPVIPESDPHFGPSPTLLNDNDAPCSAELQKTSVVESTPFSQVTSSSTSHGASGSQATVPKASEKSEPLGKTFTDIRGCRKTTVSKSSAKNSSKIQCSALVGAHEEQQDNRPVSQDTEIIAATSRVRNDHTSNAGMSAEHSQSRKSNYSGSNTDTSASSPRSVRGATVEDCIPVKYLQMSSTSPRVSKGKKDSTRGGQNAKLEKKSKYEELEVRLLDVQEQCEALAEENIRIKREQRSKAEEKIASLKKRNGELANIARRLEEKARSLQEQNGKKTQDIATLTRELQQQKRAHQRHKGRCDAEHARNLAEKDDTICALETQLEDLKKALRQTRRVKFLKSKSNDDDHDILIQNQKEMLHLQKLASAASTKVVVRSLSTPVTARQKILEESNRNLRRQISSLESNLQEAESKGSGSEQLENKLKSIEEEKQKLASKVNDLLNRALNLESELEESKVETSDISVQYSELKNIHVQLQNDYATVHEQLSVAIRERDQAVSQCIDHAGKLTAMESDLKMLRDEKRGSNALRNNQREATQKHQKELNELHSTHGNVVKEYQDALEALQSKVAVLEQQCQKQDVNNKSLKDQLSTLMTWSKQNTAQQPNASTHLDNGADNGNNNNSAELRNTTAPSETLLKHGSIPKRLDSTPNRDSPVDTSGSAFRKPVSSFHDSSGLADLRRKSSSTTSASQRGGVDLDDTEAEDFDEEVHAMVDTAAVPGSPGGNDRSALRVFIAKYNYNPFEGPNEQPEAELPLVAGDYVYVHGEMDGDGFFEGELMSGRRGLVPSNYLEAVHDAPLAKRAMPTVVNSHQDSSPGVVKPDTQHVINREGPLRASATFRPTRFETSPSVCSSATGASSMDSSSMGSHEQLTASSDDSSPQTSLLPYPRKLRVDKKLSHSLIIGWVAPQLGEDDIVEEYHVLVDGSLSTVVNGSKSKAVVEHIYHTEKCYTISVCALTERGRSEPSHCVLRFGFGDSPPAITNVRVEHVTRTSARITWQPSNSNYTHTVSIGEVIDPKRKPGPLSHYQRQILVPCPMFWHTVTGLKAESTYEVIIKSRSSKVDAETASEPVRFVTPLVMSPEPPLSVRVEEKMLDSSDCVIVTWLPVIPKHEGFSSDVTVTGYAIEVNDVQLIAVETAIRDQCQIPVKALAEHIRKIVAVDAGQSLGSGRSGAAGGSSTQRSPFSDQLPSVRITVRALAPRRQISDQSSPYHLHRTLVSRLLQIAPLEVNHRLLSHTSQSDSDDDSDADHSDADRSPSVQHFSKHQPVVPSIEITHDTSSEDDRPEVRSHSHRSPSSSELRRSQPGRRSTRKADDTSRFFDQPDPLDRRKRSKSAQFTPRNVADHGKSTTPRRALSDDDSDGSSDFTSTTTSGSLKPNLHHRRRGSPTSQSARESTHVNAGLRGRAFRAESAGLRRCSSEKRTSSPRSMHSDNQHTADASWHSHQSDTHVGSRSTPLSRRVRGRQMSSSFAKNQGGGDFVPEFGRALEDSRVSLYVALYDYDPYTMSPNTDMLEDELAFEEGQLLKIFGEKDTDGFYFGEKPNGTNGYIPCNMVSEVQVDDYTMMEDLFERGHLPSVSPEGGRLSLHADQHSSDLQSGEPSSYPSREEIVEPRLCIAMFDYDPKQLSPNIDSEAELSFRRGDVLKIFGDIDDDGFFPGELDGQFGLVPSNFVEDYCPNESSQPLATYPSQADRGKNSVVTTASATTMTELSASVQPGARKSPSFVGEPPSVASTSSNNESSPRTDSGKKKGILSKGKKLLKKLGGSESKQKK